MSTYRNAYEARVAKALGPDYDYEAVKLTYTIQHTYMPDFVDQQQKRIVEAEGLFDAADRRKMLAVRKAHPDWSIEIWFTDPERTISKTSNTTYQSWCSRRGIIAKQGPRT